MLQLFIQQIDKLCFINQSWSSGQEKESCECVYFSEYLFWWPWQFSGVLVCYSTGGPVLESVWCWDYGLFVEDHRRKVSSLSHHVKATCCQLGSGWLMLTLISRLKWSLSSFSMVSHSSPPTPLLYCALWKEVPVSSPHLQSGEFCSPPPTLRMEYLHKIFELLCNRLSYF